MAYERLGEGALNYYQCQYGASKLVFRGPKKKLSNRFVATIGGTETYGKFVELPYPAMLEDLLDLPVANFGCVNAGIDAYLGDQTILENCKKASATILQVGGVQHLSNRFYSVHARRNDRFIKASPLLTSIYPGLDLTDVHFTGHLLTVLQRTSPLDFQVICQDLKETWVARMQALIDCIDSPVVLLWMADHAPGENPEERPLGHDPMFVERWMLDELQPDVAAYVEINASRQEIAAGFERMIFGPLEAPAAEEMLGPIVHEVAARKLQTVMGALLTSGP